MSINYKYYNVIMNLYNTVINQLFNITGEEALITFTV